ncbi:MAG: T9SS type A sorting domain-containing protein [Saprospiraceae bacterium]|nr:T9SS type A sorting domain-containing protein [Saprospiraceae bacterium]
MKKIIFILLAFQCATVSGQNWYSKIIDPFGGKHELADAMILAGDTLLIRARTIGNTDSFLYSSVLKYDINSDVIIESKYFEEVESGANFIYSKPIRLLLSSQDVPDLKNITVNVINKLSLQHDSSISLTIPDNRYYSHTIKKAIKFGDKFFMGGQALDNQIFIPYTGWYKDQENAVFFVLNDDLQTDTVLIIPPTSGAFLKIEDLAVGSDSILYVSFLEKYLVSNVPFPYLEDRHVIYGFDKGYQKVFEWFGPDFSGDDTRSCLAVAADSTLYHVYQSDYSHVHVVARRPAGQVIWDMKIDSTIGQRLYHISKLMVAQNGDLVVAGAISAVGDKLGLSGFIARISPQGVLKWKRAFRVNQNFDPTLPEDFPYQAGFKDLAELPGGDLLAAGYVRKYVGGAPPANPFNFDIWLVRTSSEGCLWDDCGYIQDIVTKDNYIPLVTPDNEWVADYFYPLFPSLSPEIRRYTFSSDSTLLSGKYYRQLIYSKNMSSGPWQSTGEYLREDNGKVFKIWGNGNQPERLIYDMDFGVGDTLVPHPDPALGQGDRKIVQVGTIELLDGEPRKFLLLKSSQCIDTTMWIEGMGDVARLFWTEVFCSMGEDFPPAFIRCFSTNGQLLYKRPDVDGCYTSSSKDVVLPEMKVYPNPASDVLLFDMEDISLINSVNIFDATGHLMLSNQKFLSKSKIDVSHLPNGFYIGIAYFKNETQKSFKIIINR